MQKAKKSCSELTRKVTAQERTRPGDRLLRAKRIHEETDMPCFSPDSFDKRAKRGRSLADPVKIGNTFFYWWSDIQQAIASGAVARGGSKTER